MGFSKKRRIVLALLMCGAMWVIVALADRSHHSSLKYFVWKHFAVGDWRYGARFLNVDPAFRQSFEGKSRAHLLHWFPALQPGASRVPVCPGDGTYGDQQQHGEWIGDTPWLVLYSGEKVKEIIMPKGC